ncbi:metallophosphoesterase [Lacinutrix iliipiscaria]|uniref:Metallophosphoesterase n=1 Tax=Lacinutrix iliipiscaria TaxID=1230532 RepID=A0ABW5WKT5_9FLAO
MILALLLFNACATYKKQYNSESHLKTFPQDRDIVHSFYFIGDAGNSDFGKPSPALEAFEKELNNASKNSTAVFLGDNIYPKGLPKKEQEGRAFAENQLQIQTDVVKDFKGNTIFIPGNHDWYSDGLKGLKRQEKYIEDRLGKNTFLPENGCPIEKVNINEEIVLIIIDSQWYLENWDNHPTINDDCQIKTKANFFDEFEGQIKKAIGKTTIVAMHHPLFSNGPHGGQYSIKQQLFPLNNNIPLPIIGSLINVVRRTGGLSNADLQNKKYIELKKRIITLAQENRNVIFASGHEHSLQYLVEDNIPQIISGSGSKTSETRAVGTGQFSYGTQGYARLDVFKDGSSYVRYYSVNDNRVVFEIEVIPPQKKEATQNYSNEFPATKKASIYTEEETNKSALYKIIWGKRYRKYYNTDVEAPIVNLDTLFGGLTPVRKGGGHQSNSLRLKDKEGKEYVMRALRKNALRYIQSTAFKDQYIAGQFDDTFTENLILDVFTGSHPYAPFTIGKMADAIGVFHTNPVLYYVPKQNALSQFNDDFGDELYMIEERAASGHGDQASFGFSNKVISTNDMLEKLREDESYIVDEEAYIRARLFDMLIGDWDRHEDQWRWAEFNENGRTVYRPMPRDRDQAYSILADGVLLNLLTRIIPGLRLLHSYEEKLRSPKWFNVEPYPLDMALINRANKDLWDAQVKYIQTHITDEVIEDAFNFFPTEVYDETIHEIAEKLKGRRAKLQKTSDTYFKHLHKFAAIKGTDKDDWFDIKRLPNGETQVIAYRIIKGEKGKVFHNKTYNKKITKEIWIYGLDDEDTFHVFGDGNHKIKIRIIGGQNKDTYTIDNNENIVVYDFETKKSEFTTNIKNKRLKDDYETNIYDHKKLKNSQNQLIPSIGYNPDDGFKMGINNTYTTYSFERNPYTTQHVLGAAFYFATNGFDLNYKGEFANVLGEWNLGMKADYTSSNYSINFFGYGNSTLNPNKEDKNTFDRNYNRVKYSTIKVAPSLIWYGELGSRIEGSLIYESIEVEETQDRFINTFYVANGEENNNNFIGAEADYSFVNLDNKAFPTMGLQAHLTLGYKTNLKEAKSFGYIIPSLAFNYKLIPNGQLVLATKLKGHVNLGHDFEFYQAASLGASDGLRGYRNQRFAGQNAFYQNIDVRLNLRKVKTSLLPLNIGIYGGFDYGRVWIDDKFVMDPSFNKNEWNKSLGGGFFLNAADFMTANLSVFNSDDGIRLAFKMGFGF